MSGSTAEKVRNALYSPSAPLRHPPEIKAQGFNLKDVDALDLSATIEDENFESTDPKRSLSSIGSPPNPKLFPQFGTSPAKSSSIKDLLLPTKQLSVATFPMLREPNTSAEEGKMAQAEEESPEDLTPEVTTFSKPYVQPYICREIRNNGLHPNYSRLLFEDAHDQSLGAEDVVEDCAKLIECLNLRAKYLWKNENQPLYGPPPYTPFVDMPTDLPQFTFGMKDGIFLVYRTSKDYEADLKISVDKHGETATKDGVTQTQTQTPAQPPSISISLGITAPSPRAGFPAISSSPTAAQTTTPLLPSSTLPVWSVLPLRSYYKDLNTLLKITSSGPVKTFCFRRLELLEQKYHLHILLNSNEETHVQKTVPHRDFYNVRKVDTHIHHSASMNQKHLLRFIKKKIKVAPNDKVLIRNDKVLTLQEVFDSLNLTPYDLSVDTLDVHADRSTFHRFDRFNLKYNPFGQSRLREIFLKTDNYINGRYLAEITQELMVDLEASKYQHVEWRLSIYGRDVSEWSKLASWVVDHNLIHDNVRWLIQIPRLYSLYKKTMGMPSYQSMLHNIFWPLFQITKDPSWDPKLDKFLKRVVAFDSVDDESKPERNHERIFPRAGDWTNHVNPPYSYYTYYIYANLYSLNCWRAFKHYNTFAFRPHCGEAGEVDHLGSAFLCANHINHGIQLRKAPVLQYLFYLEQIGLAVSPLSNNALFLKYSNNPFPSYFARGLNVSLSTDDPLQFHWTKEPLMEEYSVASSVYGLNNADVCEIARNSVLQSGFDHHVKQKWIGKKYYLPGTAGNDIRQSNVPNIRIAYRHETLLHEWKVLLNSASLFTDKEKLDLRRTRELVEVLEAHTKHVDNDSDSEDTHEASFYGLNRTNF